MLMVLYFCAGCLTNSKGMWHSTNKPMWTFTNCCIANGPWSFRWTAGSQVAMAASFSPQLCSANVRTSHTWLLPAFSIIWQWFGDVRAHAPWCQADNMSCTHIYWMSETKYGNKAAISWLNWLSFRFLPLHSISWLFCLTKLTCLFESWKLNFC